MPSQLAHLELAQHNQELIDHLMKDPHRFPDWVTTVAFYRALHLVEAVFAQDAAIKHGGDHGSRQRHLKSNRRYAAIYKAYHPLWTASIVARYLEDRETGGGVSSFAEYLTVDQVKATILNHYLRKVESSVEQLLGRPLQRPPASPP
jgi:hypothetical protein